MGVSQSKPPMVASAPPTPHPSAARTSSGVAVVPVKSRALGCFPPGRKPVGPATRATRASSVASSEGGDRSPRRSSADVSQLLADLKGASPSRMRDTRARLSFSRLPRTAVRLRVLTSARPDQPLQTTGCSTPSTRSPRTSRRAKSRSWIPRCATASCPRPSRRTRRATARSCSAGAPRVRRPDPPPGASPGRTPATSPGDWSTCRSSTPRTPWRSAPASPPSLPGSRPTTPRCAGTTPCLSICVEAPDAVLSVRDARAARRRPDAAVLAVALDGASRAAARRIAAQLVRHEAEHGATAALDATARCGRMLKRRVTPAPPPPPGAAAAARVGDAGARLADIDGIGKVAEGAPSTATWPPRGTRSWWSSPPRRSGCGGSWARSRRAAARRRETSSAAARATARGRARADVGGAASAAPRRARAHRRARARRRGGHKFGVPARDRRRSRRRVRRRTRGVRERFDKLARRVG